MMRPGYLVALLTLLFTPLEILADTVVLRDGKSREGTVVEERADHIIFEDPLAGRMRLEKSAISEIRRSPAGSPAVASSGGAAALSEAHRAAGRYKEAFDVLLHAAAEPGTDAAALQAQFQKNTLALLERAKGQVKTAPDRARLDYRVLYTALVEKPQVAQGLLGQSTWERIYSTTREDLGRIDIELAESISNQPSLSAQRKALLAEASAINPENHDYRLALAEAARAEGDYQTAHQAYLQIVNSAGASSDLKMKANDGLARVETASNGRFAKPTPVPTATPVIAAVTPAATPAVQPEIAAATPVPELTPPPGPKWKQLLFQIQNSGVWASLKELPDELASNGGAYLPLIIGVPALFLLGWVLPYQFLKFRAHRGDLAAAELLLPSKRYGICMLVPYVYRVAKAPTTKNRCPFCNKGIDNIDSYSDLNFFTCPHCRENITPIYDMRDYVDHLIQQLQSAQKRGRKGTSVNDTVEKDAMLKLVRGVLTLVVRRRASDLHLETEAEGGKIRARIDGIMYELLVLPSELTASFISAMKVMANLDITERRVPQDGKIAMWIDKNDIDLRINTSPAALGEKVTIRILNQKSINVDPTRLGLDGQNLENYERSIHKPHGLIIVTGPSGSGKSTTLYVALNELNSGDKNIVTIEDPIEYHLKGISQMQVNPGANFTFASGLRSILRQDPDVIMVGEIRDRETAEAALEAATTGHLVLTTLHTIDAPSAFSRLADLGVETRRIANAVNCIIAQRLVRTICPECKKTYKPKKNDLELLGIADKEITYVHGAGCDNCMNTGYFGRMAIYEFLVPNDSLREILEANAAITVIKELARKSGYRTLREEGINKVAQGLTTVEEVVRVTT